MGWLLLQSNGGDGRRYRLTDFVPAGVVDIAMGLDDINDLMVGQGGRREEDKTFTAKVQKTH